MKLSKVRVQNYKCIEDSGTWVVDKTTCLVGKNEAGKSALLEALYKLNPVTEDPQGFTPTEYPRRRRVRNRESKVSDANVITTHWNLEEPDLALLRDNFSEITFEPDIEVVVKKGYSNEQKWFVAGIEEQEADVVRQLIDSQRLNAVEKAPIAKCETLAGLSETIQRLEGPTGKQNNIARQIQQSFPGNSISAGIESVLKPQLPCFVYFRDYERLPGRVAIDELIRLEQRNELSFGLKIFKALLMLVNQSAEQIRDTGTSEELIMDEPGLTLHGKAQKDLLRYIHEKLEPEHQVIYTTHSPFMIDGNNIFSLRGVEDVVQRGTAPESEEVILGTKVTERILSTDRDSILPLQGKVGYDIAQTLFVGPCIFVVEGPAEWAYLKWFNRELIRRGKNGLDVRWSIAPAEGASKISAFVTLFRSQDLKIAALLDDHKEQKKLLEKLYKSKLLGKGHLLKTTEFVDQKEADFEDLIGWELFAELVNGALELQDEYQLPRERPEEAQERIVKEVEQRTGCLPPRFPEFDHFVAAKYLYSLEEEEEIQKLKGLKTALERIQGLFDRLNNLVRKG